MRIRSFGAEFCQSRSGNIAISAAITAPLLIGTLALGVDYGALSLQRRHAQTTADLAAVTAAVSPADAEQRLLDYFKDNNLAYAVRKGDSYVFADGQAMAIEAAGRTADCLVRAEAGKYVPDASRAVADRFEKSETIVDAVRVNQTCPGKLYFAKILGEPPTIEVTATAAVRKTAAFWIGSRLASLNGGILNSVLGATLGTEVSLSVLDYRALLDADVELLSFIRLLKTEASLTALTYGDVLDSKVRLGSIVAALRKSGQFSASTTAILKSLEGPLQTNSNLVTLGRVLNMDDISHLPLDSDLAGPAHAGLFDIISLSALASAGDNQLISDVAIQLPGLGGVTLDLSIGEPAVGTPPIAVGAPGSRVRTAQVRLRLNTRIEGVLALLNTSLEVPIFVEVANAEARLAEIQCNAASRSVTSVGIDAVPGVAEIAIGKVNDNAFINFADTPRVTSAEFVKTPALAISGYAQVDINNTKARSLTFTAQEIKALQVKSVSTSTPLSSLTSSLFNQLKPEINLLGLKLGLPSTTYASSFQSSLTPLTQVLDNLLYNSLLAVGVRIGEVDVGVTGGQCSTPKLVI